MILSTFTDIQYILSQQEYVDWFLEGLVSTVLLSIIGTGLGLLLGIFLAFGKRIKINENRKWYEQFWKYPVKYLCTIYSVVMRGTPMMVQAMIFSYGCLTILGVNWNNILTNFTIFTGWFYGGIIIITFNTAAYMGEIVISGLNGIGTDQTEGAKSLGMSSLKALFLVELPQALKNSIPTIANEWIVNVKDSSVLNVVGVTELYYRAGEVKGRTYKVLACYLIIAAIYLVLTLLIALFLKLLTMKLEGKKFKFNLFHSKGGTSNA